QDIDRDGAGGAVGAGDGEDIAVGRAAHELVVGSAGRVGPGAGAVDRHAAVGAIDGSGREGGGAVGIGGARRATGGQDGIGLGQVGGGGAQDRSIVGAQDVDRDGAGGAIGTGDGEDIAVGGAANELVMGGA